MRRKLALTLLGSIVCGVALATHYGTWNCSSCTLNGATPDADTTTYIQTTINAEVSQWRNGDTVTVCNATTCSTYLMASVIGGVPGMQQIAKFPRGENGDGGGNPGGSGGNDNGGFNPGGGVPDPNDPYCFSATPCDSSGIT